MVENKIWMRKNYQMKDTKSHIHFQQSLPIMPLFHQFHTL
jgi:hypothetical protein